MCIRDRYMGEAWKEKLVVENPYLYVKNKSVDRNSSLLDKYKGLREDPATKKGLMLKNSRLKETALLMTRQLEDAPSSVLNLHEDYLPPLESAALLNKEDRTEKFVTNRNFDVFSQPEGTIRYKPMKNPLGQHNVLHSFNLSVYVLNACLFL
eukprot:TRINITY_DN10969_c0_g1_i2.p1 TRINITY_DN10969_c0_g1~~TRINITY_DN10969_c0_g1_i2.p1  ORF type:complete len:152 (+),score=28.82 TRINITY_DN10969_c0_g1_i2:64-519(+)